MCAAGIATAAITAVPSQDISMTARVDPALVRSNASPSAADSTGKALVTIAIGSTEQTEVKTSDLVVEQDKGAGVAVAVGQRRS